MEKSNKSISPGAVPGLIDILGLLRIGGEEEGAWYQAVADAGSGLNDLFFLRVAELAA